MLIRFSCVCDAFGFQDNVIIYGSLLLCKQHYRYFASHGDFVHVPADIKLKAKGWLEFQIKDKGMFGFESGPVAAPGISCLPVEQACLPGPSPNLS